MFIYYNIDNFKRVLISVYFLFAAGERRQRKQYGFAEIGVMR